jgi:hypothetical protein
MNHLARPDVTTSRTMQSAFRNDMRTGHDDGNDDRRS